MDEEKIRQLIEEIDPEGKIPSGKVDELISVMKEQEINPLKDGDKIGDAVFNTLQDEPDWRKRASMAAKKISENLN